MEGGLGIRGGLDRSGLRGENVCVGNAGVKLQLETYLVDRILQSRDKVKMVKTGQSQGDQFARHYVIC